MTSTRPDGQRGRRFDVVLFDWMLTLAHYPTRFEHVQTALELIGRPSSPDAIRGICERFSAVEVVDEIRAAALIEDTSAEAHRAYKDLIAAHAGIDRELADSMYGLLGSAGFHPIYPDAAGVLTELKASGVRVGIVSDIHVDLRAHAAGHGIGELIDHWCLSFELGVQKPSPAIFLAALEFFGERPDRVLMVGDRSSHDGAAAAVGITCLIVPPPASFGHRGLDLVLDVVGIR